MSYPSTLAEIERLRQQLRNTKEWGKRKKIKNKIRTLSKAKEQYEISYYGKVLGSKEESR